MLFSLEEDGPSVEGKLPGVLGVEDPAHHLHHASGQPPPPPPPLPPQASPMDADESMEEKDCCILSQDFFWSVPIGALCWSALTMWSQSQINPIPLLAVLQHPRLHHAGDAAGGQ